LGSTISTTVFGIGNPPGVDGSDSTARAALAPNRLLSVCRLNWGVRDVVSFEDSSFDGIFSSTVSSIASQRVPTTGLGSDEPSSCVPESTSSTPLWGGSKPDMAIICVDYRIRRLQISVRSFVNCDCDVYKAQEQA